MISTAQAINHLLKLSKKTTFELIKIEDSLNRVLAKNLKSKCTHPPFNSSAMDGYALNLKEKILGKKFLVVGESAAGSEYPGIVKLGETVRIFTGAPLPQGTNCVVIQEDVSLNGQIITIEGPLENNNFVRNIGSDFNIDDIVQSPIRITPPIISLLAAMNYLKIPVRKKPRVAIIATGDELVLPGRKIPRNKIISSNSYGLAAMLESFGAFPSILPIARDNIQDIQRCLTTAMDYDLILTIGGASIGDYDLILSSGIKMGLKTKFHSVAMKPGKPLMAGKLNQTPLIALPGNPVSAMICCFIMVKPVIEKMLHLDSGETNCMLFAELETGLKKNGPREHYLRAILSNQKQGLTVKPLERQDSSLITELSKANALIVHQPLATALKTGQLVDVIPFFR